MRIVGIGDNSADRYLTLKRMFPGGNALNVAAFARQAGVEAAYIGAVGDDAAGTFLLTTLRDVGVDVSRVRVVAGPTAHADIALVDGDRTFLGSGEGVSCFEPDDADLALAQAADLVHTSVFSHLEDWIRAHHASTSISFDFSDRLDRAYVAALAPDLTCAEFSGAHLPPQEAEDFARWVVSLGARLVLVTRAADGAICCIGDRCWTQPSRTGEVVDTMGAGDAFIAAFLVAHLEGAAAEDALRRAAAAAAVTCGHFGSFGPGEPIEIP